MGELRIRRSGRRSVRRENGRGMRAKRSGKVAFVRELRRGCASLAGGFQPDIDTCDPARNFGVGEAWTGKVFVQAGAVRMYEDHDARVAPILRAVELLADKLGELLRLAEVGAKAEDEAALATEKRRKERRK